jgi:hypothetical protein
MGFAVRVRHVPGCGIRTPVRRAPLGFDPCATDEVAERLQSAPGMRSARWVTLVASLTVLARAQLIAALGRD